MQHVDCPADVQELAEPAGARRPCMNAHALHIVTCAQSPHGINRHCDRWRYVGQRSTVRTSEPKRAVGSTLDAVSFLVHGAVVPATQKGRLEGGSNWGKWSDAKFDDLAERGLKATSKAERAKLYHEAQRHFLNGAPSAIPVGWVERWFFTDKNIA